MQCKTEIEQYFLEDVETPSENFDILMWWKVNSTKFPIHAEIARDVLAIPITTELPRLLPIQHLALGVA